MLGLGIDQKNIWVEKGLVDAQSGRAVCPVMSEVMSEITQVTHLPLVVPDYNHTEGCTALLVI